MNLHVAQVIIVEDSEGSGAPGDPIRGVKRIYTLEGELIAENDPLAIDVAINKHQAEIDYSNRTNVVRP